MTQPLDVDISRVDSADVVDVRGELDLASAFALAGPLMEISSDGAGAVVLDLSGVSFMDSTGLSLLLDARRRLTRRGRRMLVVCPPGSVLRVLEMTSTLDALQVHPTRQAALSWAVKDSNLQP